MNVGIKERLEALFREHARRRKLLAAAGCASVAVAIGIFAALMVPAISMEQKTPLMEADPSSVGTDAKVTVRVTSAARAGSDTVYLLSEIGRGGGLASEYDFNGAGEAAVATDDGQSIVLHRVNRAEGSSEQVADAEIALETDGAANPQVDADTVEAERSVVDEKAGKDRSAGDETKELYWYVVPKGTTASFSIDHEATEGAQHELALRGASGATYSEAVRSLQEAMSKEQGDKPGAIKGGMPLQISWTEQGEPADEPQEGPAEDAAEGADSEDSAGEPADSEREPAEAGDGEAAAKDGEEGLSDQKIVAKLYADAEKSPSSEQGVTITLEGKLPQGATATARPVETQIDGRVVLAAYDITVYREDGSVFQPAAGSPIKVTISSSALQVAQGDDIEVYHVDPAGGASEEAGTAEREGVATMSFYAAHFSTYALTRSASRAPAETPGTLQTVDSRADGITLNLFDYDAYDEGWSSTDLGDKRFKKEINVTSSKAWRDLRFYPSGIQPSNGQYTINNYTGATPTAPQGVVKPTLDPNGYPHTTGYGNQSSNLSYLFDPDEAAGGKTAYSDVNHLFTKDADGYYRYDSGWGKKDSNGNVRGNYAYYDKAQGSGGDFVVYDRTYANDNGAASVSDASNDSIGFFPFNKYDPSKKNVKLNSYYNHHLGLTMSAQFMIPEGKTVNGNDMVFNFSGDDDMWVFVDDVLVLDIGGIHQPVSGSINFTEGTASIGENVATVNGQTGIGKSAKIADIFRAAGKTWDGSEYSTHTIKCFYLERGGCYSDLSLSFNLPFYRPGQIHVTKTVDGSGAASYMDTGFKFKVFIETSRNSGQYRQWTGAVTKDDGTVVDGADADGTYTLKSGEGFKVETRDQGLRYYVEEIDPGGAFSTTVNGQAVGKTDDNGASVVRTDAKPASNPENRYRNSVTGATVSVQKKWYEQDGTTEKTTDLPPSVTLTLHRAWDTSESGGTPTPTGAKHKVTFKATSQAVSNATVTTIDDVADGGSVTFYPYGGTDNWALPTAVTAKAESGGELTQIGTQQYGGWRNIAGYKLSNVTSDVTVLVSFNAWVTTDHTTKDHVIVDVKSYDKAGEGGGTSPGAGTGPVTHHDEVVELSGVANPVTVKAPSWRAEWDGLPMADDNGNPYTYYVDESTVPAGYEVVYENNGTTNGDGSHTGIPSGEVTVKNKVAYTLPHTGGVGVAPMACLGACALGVATALLISMYRRARRSRG